MAKPVTAAARAAALLGSPAARGQPAFAARAAACHALAAFGVVPGFDMVALWPAHLAAFERLTPDEHRALAAALLAPPAPPAA